MASQKFSIFFTFFIPCHANLKYLKGSYKDLQRIQKLFVVPERSLKNMSFNFFKALGDKLRRFARFGTISTI